MPIIKDKYGAKGSQTRSKYVTRTENRARMESAPVGLSTEQKREIEKQAYRRAPENKNQTSVAATSIDPIVAQTQPAVSQGSSTVNSLNIGTTGVQSLFSLNVGDTLNNIVIHNYNNSSAPSNIGIYWSSGDQSNITFTESSGVITATSGGFSTCIFATSVPYLTSVSLEDSIQSMFKKVNKEIFFYATSQITGPSITFSITNE